MHNAGLEPTKKRGRFKAAGVHLLASATVAALGAILIFQLWYPPPFDQIAGGSALFFLLVSVDVVLGPALTLVAASPGKSHAEFRRDLIVIVILQLVGFAYGAYTIALARPVFEAFEIDRFHVVTAADIDPDELPKAAPEFRSLPWLGPRVIAAVKPTDPAEQLRSVELGLAGVDLSMLPGNWRAYESQRDNAWHAARPLSLLLARHPEAQTSVAVMAASAHVAVADLRFLPLVSRQVSWVAVLAPPEARIIGYLPFDGFF